MEPHQKSLEIAFDRASIDAAPVPSKGESIPVGKASDMPEGAGKIVTYGGISIGVFHVSGRHYAIRNYCPHQGAPLCQGRLHTTHAPSDVGVFTPSLNGRVLRCPWHGWEFDIASGKALYDARTRVKTYATRVDDDGCLWVDL